MDKNKFFENGALRPTEEQRLFTMSFYRNANTIYHHFNDWKDRDQFYFIPLKLAISSAKMWHSEKILTLSFFRSLEKPTNDWTESGDALIKSEIRNRTFN